jgi:16S rRNA processing protein RimM
VEYVVIGQIINTHGNKGELKIYPLTDDINRFYELKKVYIKSAGPGENYISYTIETVRIHKNNALLTLQEIPDMNEAEKLKGFYIEIPRDEVRPLPEGSYYIFQLVGLDVYESDNYLGKLHDVLKTGGNDVYAVRTPENKEIYLPAIKSVILNIDLDHGRVEVKVPPGLLD